MARTKQIIAGLNNGQKFRFIIRQPDLDASIEFAMTMTIQEFNDKVASTVVRKAVTIALEKLSNDRHEGKHKHGWSGVPSGLLTRVTVYDHKEVPAELDVQVDLY